MKSVKTISIIFSLALAITAVGCGKNNDDNNNNNPNGTVVTQAAVPLPIPNYGTQYPNNSMPVGCYSYGSSTCNPCPQGYTQSGQSCVYNGSQTGANQFGCYYGTFWNGFYCQQVGYQITSCPYGTSWSQMYMGCIAYQGYQPNCKYKSYLGGFVNTYVCY